MRNVVIDITDLGGNAHPEDRVVLWKPTAAGSASTAGRIISTAPVTVKLVAGKATVEDVEPGPMRVLLQCRGVESTGPVTVTVPDGAGPVTLRSLFESQFEYSPPVVSAVQAAVDRVIRIVEGLNSWSENAVWAFTSSPTKVKFSVPFGSPPSISVDVINGAGSATIKYEWSPDGSHVTGCVITVNGHGEKISMIAMGRSYHG